MILVFIFCFFLNINSLTALDLEDAIDNDETENQYVMKACFSNNNDSIIIRIYYGNVTEEIGYVDVVEITI